MVHIEILEYLGISVNKVHLCGFKIISIAVIDPRLYKQNRPRNILPVIEERVAPSDRTTRLVDDPVVAYRAVFFFRWVVVYGVDFGQTFFFGLEKFRKKFLLEFLSLKFALSSLRD
jgi:hypothetical protein